MNRLWSGMLLLGIAYGAFCGKLPEVTDGALCASKEAVVLAISLLGVTGLWSGLMEIARKAGMIDRLVKKMGPVMRFLFPKVPSDHPAIQSAATNMICNVSALAQRQRRRDSLPWSSSKSWKRNGGKTKTRLLFRKELQTGKCAPF